MARNSSPGTATLPPEGRTDVLCTRVPVDKFMHGPPPSSSGTTSTWSPARRTSTTCASRCAAMAPRCSARPPGTPDDGPAQRPSGDHGRIPRPGRSRREQPVLGGDEGLPHQPPRRTDRAVGGPPPGADGASARRWSRDDRPPAPLEGGRSIAHLLKSRARERLACEGAAESHVALRHPERVSDVAAVVLIHVADLGMCERRLTALAQSDV